MRLAFAPLRGEFFGRELVSVEQARGIRLAERDVRGGIFVEERVEEDKAALRDGRRVGNERHFAQAARAVVGVDEFFEHFLAARGVGLNDAAVLKADLDAFDHGALMRERLGGGDDAVGAVLVRRGEDFFRRHVGDAVVAVARGGAAAEPLVIVGEAETKIGAGSAILQGRVALFIQERGALVQFCVVRLPCADGIGAC